MNGRRLPRGVGAALLDLSCDSRVVQIEPSSGMVIVLTFNDINPINMGPSQAKPHPLPHFSNVSVQNKNLVTKQILELDFGFCKVGHSLSLTLYIYIYTRIFKVSYIDYCLFFFKRHWGSTTRRKMKSVLIIILLLVMAVVALLHPNNSS